MTRKKVIVIGGGVAGLSAAHELVERGFEVEVYEKNKVYAGGKARSVEVEGTENPKSGKSLPGEHGFRFFPGFYRHITDTMKRIPFSGPGDKARTCYDNLVPTSRIMLARYAEPELITVANFPRSITEFKVLLKFVKDFENCGLSKAEISLFKAKVLQLMTSCRERRNDEYEQLGWWEYMDASQQSVLFQHLLVGGMVRTLVAAQAKTASTKTGGTVFLQLLLNMATPGVNTDRVLNGPTNERWLKPWLEYLRGKGVKYYFAQHALHFNLDKGCISSVAVKDQEGVLKTVTGDYYLLAVPVERAAEIAAKSTGLFDADDNLSYLKDLAENVSWMNGIQYYLNEDVAINTGHVIYSDSEWAVTSISQRQFWGNYDFSDRFNGRVKGIVSVDVSDWLHTTFDGKLAKDCSREEIRTYVWEQMKKSLNLNGKVVLRDDMIEFYYIDSDIHDAKAAKNLELAELQPNEDVKERYFNREPLLVNTVHSWTLRPEARTNIPNLMLAADYVRTNTDLATMEGANEAARRAVNCIIDASGSNATYCKIWNYSEPWALAPFKWYDNARYRKGLPHAAASPWYIKALAAPMLFAYTIEFLLRALWVFIFH